MSELPLNWASSTLGDLAGAGQYGWTTKASDQGKVKFLRTTDITKGKIDWQKVPFCSEAPSDVDKYSLSVGDILISRAGSVGFSSLLTEVPETAVFASYLIRYMPNLDIVSPRYLAHYLKSQEYWNQIADVSAGVALANVNATKLAALALPLAPLPEQKRIADKLDVVLAQVDACRDRLDRIPMILKRFRQAVLAVATSGKLTEDWRSITKSIKWNTLPLSDICLSITDGDHQAPPQAETGIPFITISAINDGYLRLEKASRFVPVAYFDALKESRRPQRGDILFSVTGSIGIPAMVDTDSVFTFQRHIAILKPNHSKVSSSYLKFVLGADSVQQQALAVATGTAQLTIPLNGLRSFMIKLPSQEEQTEIVRRVEALFAYADRLEARYTAARTQVEKLTPATLAKAFRGELVPQDPSDEPASELLERIITKRTSKVLPLNKTSSKRKEDVSMKPRNVIPIIEALRLAKKPLSAQALLVEAGYPADAETELIERFLLDIRKELEEKRIERIRKGNDDFFSIVS